MGALIQILIMLFLLVFGSVQSSSVIPPPPVEIMPTPALETTRVEIRIDGAFQANPNATRIELYVVASLDGCNFPVQIEQRQDDHDVYVTLYRDMPLNVMCPAVLRHYEQTITLDGTFVSGETYTIHVNDFVLTVTI